MSQFLTHRAMRKGALKRKLPRGASALLRKQMRRMYATKKPAPARQKQRKKLPRVQPLREPNASAYKRASHSPNHPQEFLPRLVARGPEIHALGRGSSAVDARQEPKHAKHSKGWEKAGLTLRNGEEGGASGTFRFASVEEVRKKRKRARRKQALTRKRAEAPVLRRDQLFGNPRVIDQVFERISFAADIRGSTTLHFIIGPSGVGKRAMVYAAAASAQRAVLHLSHPDLPTSAGMLERALHKALDELGPDGVLLLSGVEAAQEDAARDLSEFLERCLHTNMGNCHDIWLTSASTLSPALRKLRNEPVFVHFLYARALSEKEMFQAYRTWYRNLKGLGVADQRLVLAAQGDLRQLRMRCDLRDRGLLNTLHCESDVPSDSFTIAERLLGGSISKQQRGFESSQERTVCEVLSSDVNLVRDVVCENVHNVTLKDQTAELLSFSLAMSDNDLFAHFMPGENHSAALGAEERTATHLWHATDLLRRRSVVSPFKTGARAPRRGPATLEGQAHKQSMLAQLYQRRAEARWLGVPDEKEEEKEYLRGFRRVHSSKGKWIKNRELLEFETSHNGMWMTKAKKLKQSSI